MHTAFFKPNDLEAALGGRERGAEIELGFGRFSLPRYQFKVFQYAGDSLPFAGGIVRLPAQ